MQFVYTSNIRYALPTFIYSHKHIRYIEYCAEYNNTYDGNFSPFNRIKRSRLMRFDDAVESVEGHT